MMMPILHKILVDCFLLRVFFQTCHVKELPIRDGNRLGGRRSWPKTGGIFQEPEVLVCFHDHVPPICKLGLAVRVLNYIK